MCRWSPRKQGRGPAHHAAMAAGVATFVVDPPARRTVRLSQLGYRDDTFELEPVDPDHQLNAKVRAVVDHVAGQCFRSFVDPQVAYGACVRASDQLVDELNQLNVDGLSAKVLHVRGLRDTSRATGQVSAGHEVVRIQMRHVDNSTTDGPIIDMTYRQVDHDGPIVRIYNTMIDAGLEWEIYDDTEGWTSPRPFPAPPSKSK